jgi:general secretion pathway protein K
MAQYNKEPNGATSARQRSHWASRGADRRAERGAALLLVLLIVALLMTLVLEFDRSVRLEHRAAGNYRDATAAFYLARAGLAEGRALLLQDQQADQKAGVKADSLSEVWALPGETPLGPGVMRVSIVDEERFFPINSLITGKNTPNPTRVAQFQRLLRSLQIDDRLADAVMDWIDENDEARPGGAENSYYEVLPTPYRAHNRPMDSLAELRFVKGVTDEVYDRLAPHLTTVQDYRMTTNLNTADRMVLGALDSEMTPDLVDRLIAGRPIDRASDVLGLSLAGGDLSQYISISSRYFTIEAEGIVNGVSKVVSMRVNRDALDQKPLWVRTQS